MRVLVTAIVVLCAPFVAAEVATIDFEDHVGPIGDHYQATYGVSFSSTWQIVQSQNNTWPPSSGTNLAYIGATAGYINFSEPVSYAGGMFLTSQLELYLEAYSEADGAGDPIASAYIDRNVDEHNVGHPTLVEVSSTQANIRSLRVRIDGGTEATLDDFVFGTIDDEPPTITCPADVDLTYPAADTSPEVTGYATASDSGGAVVVTYSDVVIENPTGCVRRTERTWTATDQNGNAASCMQVIDEFDLTPPEIESLWADPHVLWPPNHKMVLVTVNAVVSDDCDEAPTYKIVSVQSSEAETGSGKGDAGPDWEILSDHTVNLRSERYGIEGRIYTVTVEAVDASGNQDTEDVLVAVPHDQGTGSSVCPVCGQVH